jgi:hypothetical protein
MDTPKKQSLNFLQFIAFAIALFSLFAFMWLEDTEAALYWILAALFVYQAGRR